MSSQAVMQFGPEWLRDLTTASNANNIMSPPGYGAASGGGGTMVSKSGKSSSASGSRHRYTREELIAIFDEDAEPRDIPKLKSLEIFKAEPQAPAVLKYRRDEETKVGEASVRGGPPGWSQGRVMPSRFAQLGEENGPGRGSGLGPRGRAIAISDRGIRGRGRGAGGRDFHGSYDDDERGFERPEYGRGRGERPMHRNERGYDRDFEGAGRGERGKYERHPSFGQQEVPPGRGMPSRATAVSDWRNAPKEGNDRDGWRNARSGDQEPGGWNNRRRDWRAEDERGGGYEDGGSGGYRNGRRYHDDRRESLPEWMDPEEDETFGFGGFGGFNEDGIFVPEGTEESQPKSTDEKKKDQENDAKANGQDKSIENTDNGEKKENNGYAEKESNKDPRDASNDLKAHPNEDDDFSYLQRETERLRFEDEDNVFKPPTSQEMPSHPNTSSGTHSAQSSNTTSLMTGHLHVVHGQAVRAIPVAHPEAYKWLYLDPQQETQGPFTSKEMLDWFKAGYFLPDLLVRRACDDCFIELGKLMRFVGSVPFIIPPAQQPPPIISGQPIAPYSSSSGSQATRTPANDGQSRLDRAPLMGAVPKVNHGGMPSNAQPQDQIQSMLHRMSQQQQQAPRQVLPQQQPLNNSADIQNQLRTLLGYLKQQDGFNRLSEPQQKNVLLQMQTKLMSQQQEQQRTAAPSQPNIPSESNINPTLAQLFNRKSPISSGQPSGQFQSRAGWSGVEAPSGQQPLYASDLEQIQQKEHENHEHIERERRLAQQQKSIEEETRNRAEMEEMMRKRQEEDMRHLEEIRRKNEEAERLRREMIRQKEEEELRRRQAEEQRILRESQLKREAEEAAAAEQERQRRIDEGRRLLQQSQEHQRRMEEAQRAEQERQRQHEQARLREQEMIRAQKLENLRQLEAQKQNPWSDEPANQSSNQSLSLSDIQRAQEEKEREEREKKKRREQQQAQQQLMRSQQMEVIMRQEAQAQAQTQAQQAQQQQNKHSQNEQNALFNLKLSHSSWANTQPTVRPNKTLAEIQAEEADKLARERAEAEAKRPVAPNAGIWSNAASHLQWKRDQEKAAAEAAAAAVWGGAAAQAPQQQTRSPVSMGFWDSGPEQQQQQQSRAKSNQQQQSFSALSADQRQQPNRARKEEENVMRLFESQRRAQTDEFTQWCMNSLKSYENTLDVATFVAFLKDVESPYDISDYVRQYLPDGKETKEFVKQFVEKRSYYRNRAKQNSNEELTGPANAVIPSSVKATSALLAASGGQVGDLSANDAKGKGKKKDKKSKKPDVNAILGFQVHADPDRMQGELETLED